MRKIELILITALSVCLLSGCSLSESKYPIITDCGRTDWNTDDIHIRVDNAKPELQGYEILEEDNKVKVILTYDKR